MNSKRVTQIRIKLRKIDEELRAVQENIIRLDKKLEHQQKIRLNLRGERFSLLSELNSIDG